MDRPPLRLAPSILNADFSRLGGALRMIERGRADQVHVDVMDGHFVPNLSMGPAVVASLARRTRLPLDVHLMVTDPLPFVAPFRRAGATGLTIHAEARRPDAALRAIRRAGARAGLALRPGTRLGTLEGRWQAFDMVLLMTVEPGFGGQPFRRDMLGKIRALREAAQRRRRALDIQVDGGVTAETLPDAVAAGANVIVAGVAVFGSRDPVAAIRRLRRIGRRAGRAG